MCEKTHSKYVNVLLRTLDTVQRIQSNKPNKSNKQYNNKPTDFAKWVSENCENRTRTIHNELEQEK